MKKILSLVLAAVMLFGCTFALASCGDPEEAQLLMTPVAKENIKFGLICLHDENSTYDKNFIDAAQRTVTALGLDAGQLIIKKNIPEGDECYDAAVELVEEGCQIIFANSFGHEDYIMKAAAEFPNVQFSHATGTKAHTSALGNYHNAFASIYEGRFVAGMVAGMKLATMYMAGVFEVNADDNQTDAANEIFEGKIVDNKLTVGYVGAFPYAEVVSGYTSWFLGLRYAYGMMVKQMPGGENAPDVQMKVEYTNSWYDEAKENEKALALINGGAVLLSQHADSMGAPRACEEKGIPNVSYNGSTVATCPNTFLVSSYIDWDPYYQLIINSVINGVRIPEEYCGGFAEGSVKLTALNMDVLPAGTDEMVEDVIAEFESGNFQAMSMVLALITGDENAVFSGVFDVDGFTVDGETLTTYLANVNDDAAFTADTEVIIGGVFAESEFRAAPYFDVIIDGIIVPQS